MREGPLTLWRVTAAKLEFERVHPPTYSLSLFVLSRGFADIGKPALASEMARDFLAFQTMVAT